jgi:hypothetical protein
MIEIRVRNNRGSSKSTWMEPRMETTTMKMIGMECSWRARAAYKMMTMQQTAETAKQDKQAEVVEVAVVVV